MQKLSLIHIYSDIPVSVAVNVHCESFDMAKKIDISNRYIGSIDKPYTDDYLRFKITTSGTYVINVNGASIAATIYDLSLIHILDCSKS